MQSLIWKLQGNRNASCVLIPLCSRNACCCLNHQIKQTERSLKFFDCRFFPVCGLMMMYITPGQEPKKEKHSKISMIDVLQPGTATCTAQGQAFSLRTEPDTGALASVRRAEVLQVGYNLHGAGRPFLLHLHNLQQRNETTRSVSPLNQVTLHERTRG